MLLFSDGGTTHNDAVKKNVTSNNCLRSSFSTSSLSTYFSFPSAFSSTCPLILLILLYL
jgi:hypothetical protein